MLHAPCSMLHALPSTLHAPSYFRGLGTYSRTIGATPFRATIHDQTTLKYLSLLGGTHYYCNIVRATSGRLVVDERLLLF